MTTEAKDLVDSEESNEAIQQRFTNRILKLSALACNDSSRDDFDIEAAMNKSQELINALHATGGLQEMLGAQLLSIHRLQQIAMGMMNGKDSLASKQYFTNTAIKLANCFTQQANLLSKLQGMGAQKMIIEHVTIQSGAQAIVGNMAGGIVKK